MTDNYTKANRTALWIIGLIIAVFVIIAFFKGCFSENETVTVTHKPITGKTTIAEPQTVIIHDTVFVPKKYFGPDLSNADELKWKSIYDSVLNANIQMQIQFAKSKNKDSIYKETISPKAFTRTWDNDTLNATVYGIYFGAIPNIQLKYTIKSRKQEVKVPQTVFRLLGGIETGMTKDMNKFNIKANLGFQNKKGNVFSAGFDSDQRIYLGYTTSIFQIKR